MSNDTTRQAWALGGTVFAATLMIVLGIFQVMVGIAGIANDQVFVVTSNYVYGVDVTAWGWIHLGLGVLMVVTGIALYGMSSWARGIGIGLAALSMVNNFIFAPYYPLWAIIVIALDIFVIWALATVRPPVDTMVEPDRAHMSGVRDSDTGWPMNRPMTGHDSDMGAPSEHRAETRRGPQA